MKKLWIVFLPVLFLVVGCGGEEKTMKCTLTSKNVVSGYEMESTYTAHYKNNEVTKVVTKEKVTSESDEILDYVEEQVNTTYSKMNTTYGGYTYKITKGDGEVVSDVTIDYEKMDIDAFVKDQPTLKSYVTKNKKLKIEGLKKIYESTGATCELDS